MSKFVYLIDNGHGGEIEGNYVTAPRKMFEFPDGYVIHEGIVNRRIARKLCDMLSVEGIEHNLITPEEKDISLSERVLRADRLHAENKRSVFISIHLNAGGGKGFEVYTSVGQTKSDKFAEFFYDSFQTHYKEKGIIGRKDLSDGDNDKEAQFYVLRKTDCPAILTENGFMDNRKEAEWLNSEDGTYTVAKAHFEAIKIIEKLYSLQ